MEPGNPPIFQLLDPFGWFEDSVTKGDVKVGHSPIVLDISVRGSFEYILIVLDAIVKSADLFVEAANFTGLLSVTSGDGCKEPLCNGLEDVSIEVRVSRQSGCNGTGRHRWFQTLDWTDQERDAVFGG